MKFNVFCIMYYIIRNLCILFLNTSLKVFYPTLVTILIISTVRGIEGIVSVVIKDIDINAKSYVLIYTIYDLI